MPGIDGGRSDFTRFNATASLLALAAAGASPAFAAGTTSGSTITNTATVNYTVGGVNQNPVSASDTLTVDRKINLVVAENGTTTTTVSPGQLAAVTGFTVTNSSNAPLDFALAASQQTGGTAAHGGTDTFDTSNVKMYADTNGDGSYTPGTDQQITYLDQVAADATLKVFVVSDIPLGLASGAVANIRLTATAAEATAAGSLGATVTQSTGANTSGVDTVFADTNANGNTARDGISFGFDDYTVAAAGITATKFSRIVSDPFNGTTNPKFIPGASVEYCITVTNAAGGVAALNVGMSDVLPTTTTYDTTFGVKVNGTVTAGACNADGAIPGAQAAGTVTGTIPTLAVGDTRTMLFRVTVN